MAGGVSYLTLAVDMANRHLTSIDLKLFFKIWRIPWTMLDSLTVARSEEWQ